MSKKHTIALLNNIRTDILRAIDDADGAMPADTDRHEERYYVGGFPGLDPKGWERRPTGYAHALDPLFESVERLDATIAILTGDKPPKE